MNVIQDFHVQSNSLIKSPIKYNSDFKDLEDATELKQNCHIGVHHQQVSEKNVQIQRVRGVGLKKSQDHQPGNVGKMDMEIPNRETYTLEKGHSRKIGKASG